MSVERIVSFLPSATELLYELGLQDKLYGVTHECLYPEDAKKKPRVINTVIDGKSMSSLEIDRKTVQLMREGMDIFVLDEKNLIQARPDLIISQNTCEVCAAHSNQVARAVQILEKKPQIHSIDPHNLEQILASVSELSKIVGKEKEGERLRESLKKRIDFVKNQSYQTRPRVLAIEWISPFFSSGHWVPEMIEFAGGQNLISKTGERSRRLTFNEVRQADAEIIVVMPCGFDTKRTVSEYNEYLKNDSGWNMLRAVKNKNVYAVDANSFFSKPSIRTISGLEILAKIVHPEKFSDLEVPQNSYQLLK
jgi:iron complex transport system substrate-binding protein